MCCQLALHRSALARALELEALVIDIHICNFLLVIFERISFTNLLFLYNHTY
jgi:hypothetical protein